LITRNGINGNVRRQGGCHLPLFGVVSNITKCSNPLTCIWLVGMRLKMSEASVLNRQ
jgi:hypothetical protein